MRRRHAVVLWLAVLGCALTAVAMGRRAGPPARGSAGSHSPALSAAQLREADIRFYEARVARDPYGARDRAMLGALYLARARTSGSEADLVRAERLARTSYATRQKRNEGAASLLAGALMAQHKFTAAYDVMARLVHATPEDQVSRATLGEIALELGRYDTADSLFLALSTTRTAPAIAPRYARWLELNGRSGEARELLAATRDHLAAGFRVPPEQLAWFDLRLGELAFRNGRSDLAEAAYQRGLGLVPEDPRLLTALAQLRASDQRWREAIELGQRSLASLFDPVTLGLLSESYEAMADTAQAAEYARAMEVAVSRQPGAYHRGWALFLLDHGRQVRDMVARTRQELATRKDVYGCDVAAWALYQAGEPRAAMQLADSALRRGTRDGLLHFHAGMIALALGDSTRAETELRAALALNPHFHPRHASEARALLTRLCRLEVACPSY